MKHEQPTQTVEARNLKIGDTVRLYDGPFADAIVKQVAEGLITFWRPYGHSADFTYTGGVICYIGTETFSRYADSTEEYQRYE